MRLKLLAERSLLTGRCSLCYQHSDMMPHDEKQEHRLLHDQQDHFTHAICHHASQHNSSMLHRQLRHASRHSPTLLHNTTPPRFTALLLHFAAGMEQHYDLSIVHCYDTHCRCQTCFLVLLSHDSWILQLLVCRPEPATTRPNAVISL